MKYLSRNLRSNPPQNHPLIVRYFFNNRGSSLARSVEGLLRSILIQILQQSPKESSQLMEEYNRKKQVSMQNNEVRWDLGSLRDVFKATLAGFSSGEMLIFTDALDECEDKPKDYLSILKLATPSSGCSQSTIKVCVSSRPEPLIDAELKSYPGLRLEDHTPSRY